MVTLIAAVFMASLLGSIHCAGMCGPLVAMGVAPGRHRRPGHLLAQSAYNGGRLIGYIALGAVAGMFGAGLDLGGAYFGLQRGALILAGAGMILFGLLALLRLTGFRVPTFNLPGPLNGLFRRGHGYAASVDPRLRPLLMGLLSAFLPCGLLYYFVLMAAGSGSAVRGAVCMAVFWAGTLPIMVAVAVGVRSLAGPLRRHLPVAAAVALMLVGLAALLGRFDVPPLAAGPDSEIAGAPAPACHGDE